jgi:hypothetical protein
MLRVIAMFTACATSSSTSPVESTLKIPNGLGYGSTDDGIMVQFVRVANESRCAAGVQYVRAGEAFVTFRRTVDGGAPTETSIGMTSRGPTRLEVDRSPSRCWNSDQILPLWTEQQKSI